MLKSNGRVTIRKKYQLEDKVPNILVYYFYGTNYI